MAGVSGLPTQTTSSPTVERAQAILDCSTKNLVRLEEAACVVLNERHLQRLMAEYVRYYHEDRTHLGLGKDTPAGRPIAARSSLGSKIQSLPRLGGLHHRYAVAA